MALCTRKETRPEFPKLMGASTPRGNTLTLTDMGPEFGDPDGRYVLVINAEIRTFGDPDMAQGAWQTAFSACFATPEKRVA